MFYFPFFASGKGRMWRIAIRGHALSKSVLLKDRTGQHFEIFHGLQEIYFVARG